MSMRGRRGGGGEYTPCYTRNLKELFLVLDITRTGSQRGKKILLSLFFYFPYSTLSEAPSDLNINGDGEFISTYIKEVKSKSKK